jgi:hypothetical protein
MGLTLGPVYDREFADNDAFATFTDGKDLVRYKARFYLLVC